MIVYKKKKTIYLKKMWNLFIADLVDILYYSGIFSFNVLIFVIKDII